MQATILALLTAGLGRDLAKILAGFVLTTVLGLAFTVSLIAVALGHGTPGIATPTPLTGSPPDDRAAAAITAARSALGVPYVWGGASPEAGFDCSGLVQWAYRQAGIDLPRAAQEQYDATPRVSRARLQPGDLLFYVQTYPSADWVTHVGIYVGSGMMIAAPAEGDVVRVMPAFNAYWARHYVGAGRIGE